MGGKRARKSQDRTAKDRSARTLVGDPVGTMPSDEPSRRSSWAGRIVKILLVWQAAVLFVAQFIGVEASWCACNISCRTADKEGHMVVWCAAGAPFCALMPFKLATLPDDKNAMCRVIADEVHESEAYRWKVARYFGFDRLLYRSLPTAVPTKTLVPASSPPVSATLTRSKLLPPSATVGIEPTADPVKSWPNPRHTDVPTLTLTPSCEGAVCASATPTEDVQVPTVLPESSEQPCDEDPDCPDTPVVIPQSGADPSGLVRIPAMSITNSGPWRSLRAPRAGWPEVSGK